MGFRRCLLLFLLLARSCSRANAECEMLNEDGGSKERTISNSSADSCKSACESNSPQPCLAAVFTESSRTCVVISGVTLSDSQAKEFVKNVQTCQSFPAVYWLDKVTWSQHEARADSSSRDEGECKTRCISDSQCIVAAFYPDNKMCQLYGVDAVITSQPAKGAIVFQWQYSSNIWVWILIACAAVVLLILLALLVYCCCRGTSVVDPDNNAKVKKIFDPENPPSAPVKSKMLTKMEKLMKGMPTPAGVSSLYNLLYYQGSVEGDSAAVDRLSVTLREKLEDTLHHLGDTIIRTYFDSKGPFQLKKILVCDGFGDPARLVRKGGGADYDVNFFLLLDNMSISPEQLHYPYGAQSPYVQLRVYGDAEQKWHDFVDGGFLSPYRLKERLYKNLRQSYVPLCVGNSRVDAAFIVGISEFSSVSIFEQRIESSIGNGVSKVTPTAVPYKNSVPKSHYDVAVDLVLAIKCDGWPLCANEWVNRVRMYDWPPVAVVEDILRHGVHVVPRSPSPNEPLCFRLSFATAEKLLSDSFTPTRQQIYRSAREVLRFLLSEDGKDLQDSSIPFAYCLKNIMFYQCEELSPALWYRGDRMPERLLALMSQLEQCLLQGVCSHYFVPAYNILNCSASEAALRRAAGMVKRCLTDLDLMREALHHAVHHKSKLRMSSMGVYRFRMASQKIEGFIRDAAASPSAVYERSSESSALIGAKSQNYGTAVMT